jgi:hypothetical protein
MLGSPRISVKEIASTATAGTTAKAMTKLMPSVNVVRNPVLLPNG